MSVRLVCLWGVGLLAALMPVPALAQRPPDPIDTAILVYYTPAAPQAQRPDADSLPDAAFRVWDPARAFLIDDAHLGNLGSPSRPLLYRIAPRSGFHIGTEVYELYRVEPMNLRFYRSANTFSEVSFLQGPNRNNVVSTARISRRFSDGIAFALEFRNLNHAGQFRYQKNRHTALSAGIHLPFGERYEAFVLFTSNANRSEENGGVASDAFIVEGGLGGPAAAAIRLPTQRAETRHAQRALDLIQYYRLAGKEGRRLRIGHRLRRSDEVWKFNDRFDGAGAGSERQAFYPDFLLVDDRGLRQYNRLRRWDHQAELTTFRTRPGRGETDRLSAGLRHSFFQLEQTPVVSRFTNTFLTGRLLIAPTERLRLDVRGELGMLTNIGEYLLEGEAGLGLGRWGFLRAGLISRRYPPGQLAQSLWVSNRQIWTNNFAKPVESALWASLALPRPFTEIAARSLLLNNFIYFDQQGRPQQLGAPIQIQQLSLQNRLRIGAICWDNTIALQRLNRSDVLRLPTWFYKGSVYYSGKIFKRRLLLESGLDFRIHAAFTPDAWQPVIGQFQLQDTFRQTPFPWADVFAAIKVQSFRLFVRYENLYNIVRADAVYYNTAWHPQNFQSIRIGINWRFLDPSERPDGADGAAPPPAGPDGTRPPPGVFRR
ncbi:MAG: putative porin [Saprospiraceae bacterium]